MTSLIQIGRNALRKETSDEVACLVDAAAYFKALSFCLERAQRSIYIAGWNTSAHLQLNRGAECSTEFPNELGALLHALIHARPDLQIYVLSWDFPLPYGANRESPAAFSFKDLHHDRFHIHMDDFHPIGAAHHQKFIVIDDDIAFAGGIDVCTHRWDTPEHKQKDPRRLDKKWGQGHPFHDVQMMVSGPAAAALGNEFRERWKNATENLLKAVRPVSRRELPPFVPVEFRNIPVAISRTRPHFGGLAEQREIEALTLDIIKGAKKHLYLENQYITSRKVARALADRLREADGPEIVLILSKRANSFLELCTMEVLQIPLLRKLRKADIHARLAVCYPRLKKGLGQSLIMHSKVMVADDTLLKIGSSNFNSRSMGFDTECDLTLEAQEKPEFEKSIFAFRSRLLAEHLGSAPEKISQQLTENSSLVALVSQHQQQERSLQPLRRRLSWALGWLVCFEQLADPETPTRREQMLSEFMKNRGKQPPRLSNYGIGLVILSLIALAMLWAAPNLWEIRLQLQHDPLGSFKVVLGVVLLGAFLVPTIFPALACFALLGLTQGFVTAWSGLILLSCLQYGIGLFLPLNFARQMVMRRMMALSRLLAYLRTKPFFVLRSLPVAPFSALNLLSGLLGVPFRSFLATSILGSLPYLFGLSLVHIVLQFTVILLRGRS